MTLQKQDTHLQWQLWCCRNNTNAAIPDRPKLLHKMQQLVLHFRSDSAKQTWHAIRFTAECNHQFACTWTKTCWAYKWRPLIWMDRINSRFEGFKQVQLLSLTLQLKPSQATQWKASFWSGPLRGVMLPQCFTVLLYLPFQKLAVASSHFFSQNPT